MEYAAQIYTRPYYRRTLILYTFAIIVTGAIVASMGVLAVFPSHLGDDYGAALHTIRHMETSLLGKIIWIYILITVLTVMAIAYLHLFYSHRIAGPAFRLGREAELIGKGNLKADFKLRQKDSLGDMADSLKQVASRYRDAVANLNRQTDAVAAQAEALGQMIAQDRAPLDAAMQELSNAVKKNDAALIWIKTI